MLQRIGERVKGWFAWLIIIVIAITFTLFGASYYLGQKGASETMAVIGDSIITKGEFDTAYRRLKRQTKVLTQAIEIQLKDQAMKQLVFNHVVMEAAAKEGFVITKEQAQAAIMAIPQFLEEGKFSQERFQQTLSSNLFTPQSFLQEVKQGMLLNQQRFLFTASSFVLPTELDRFIQLATETRDYRYLTISPATMSDIKVTEDELKAYYKKHAQDFMKEEQVSIDYVELSMKALTASISISEPDLKAYFEDNKANYITPARYKLAHILILSTDKKQDEAKLKEVTLALKEGKPFADVAKRYSSDLLSLNAELPWMTVGTMGGAFDKTLIALEKGKVSSPIQTKQGYEIIKLIDKQPMKVLSFDEVKSQIRRTLTIEEAQKVFVQKSEELADLSYQSPDSLKPTEKALGVSIKSTPLFSKKGLSKGIAHYPQIITSAFSSEVLTEGDNSQPIQLNDDAVVVIRIKEHVLPKRIPFDVVKDKVTALLSQAKKEQKAKKLGHDILMSLKSGESVEAVLKANGLSFKALKEVSRDETRVAKVINQFAFDGKVSQEMNANYEGKAFPSIDSFVIVQLQKVTPGNLAKMNQSEKKAIREQLEASYGVRDYDLYLQSLMAANNVERKAN